AEPRGITRDGRREGGPMSEPEIHADAARPPAPLRPPNDATAAEEVYERADTVWTGSRREPRTEAGGGRRARGPGGRGATVGRRELRGAGGRVAIVDGCRTPFAKAGTDLQAMDVVDLASAAAAELTARTGIDPEAIEMSVFGCVIPALHAPNLGREVVLST